MLGYNIDTILDTEIDSALRYRVGYLNPIPLLLLYFDSPDSKSTAFRLDRYEWETISASITDILRAKKLKWFNIDFFRRYPTTRAATDADNTILIKAQHEDQKFGIEAILALLRRHGEQVKVEILDDRAYKTVNVANVANVEKAVAQNGLTREFGHLGYFRS